MSNDKTESISDNLRHFADIKEPCSPLIAAFREFGIDETTNWDDVRCLFRRIADEIDREIAEAKEAYLGDEFARFAEVIGKPMMEDETIEGWLGRWYLPRPLFEDGEPVQFGDTFVTDSGYNATLSSLNYTKGDHDYVSANGGQRHKVTSRLKCPEPQVLDADGVPIEIGDKVWLVPGEHCDTYPLNGYEAGVEYKVNENNSPNHKPNGRICITGGDCIYGYPMPEQVIHREPDTQERIDRDALKSYYEYWGCDGVCSRCPARIDDEKPHDRYDTSPSCTSAMTIDLLRRQRELDGRDA